MALLGVGGRDVPGSERKGRVCEWENMTYLGVGGEKVPGSGRN